MPDRINYFEYVVLLETAHGKRYWESATDPDTVKDPGQKHLTLGPYLVGPDGYENVREAIESDPRVYLSLDDPDTWEDLDDSRYGKDADSGAE